MKNSMFLCTLYNKLVDAKNYVNTDNFFITAMMDIHDMIEEFIKNKNKK